MARDPFRYFRVEGRDLVDEMSRGVLALEHGPPAPDLVPKLLRLAHTLKGAARVVRQIEIAELAHAIEDTLAPLRDVPAVVPHERVDTVLLQLDAIGRHVAALPAPTASAATGEPAAAPASEASARMDSAELDVLLEHAGEVSVRLGVLRRTTPLVSRARNLADFLADQLASSRASFPVDRSMSMVERAEELQGLIRGLDRTMGGELDRLEREIQQLRETAERLRLTPAHVIFASLERTARDTAHMVGCRVTFTTAGGDVRLDAHVLGAVQGALLQMVRNGVAHGIEPEAERIHAGKPACGHLSVAVVRRGSRVAFICTDDGRGVNLDHVRRLAQERGWAPTETASDDTEALLALLLQGGLTTSSSVTEASGRGVGLDVVRETAARLGGEVTMRTDANGGTRVELVVPVSTSSLEALVVEAAGATVAIPLEAIRGTLLVSLHDMTRSATGESIVYEGMVIPFVPLARCLGGGGVAPPTSATTVWPGLVIDSGTGRAAIGVDRLLEITTVVFRPPPALARADAIVLGMSSDALGNPRLVLDPPSLVARAAHVRPADPLPSRVRPPILVIDDSLTTRMLEQSILESAGYAVEVASSAEEALEKAGRRAYGMFLVDVEMPGMDGFTFVEWTRADPALRAVPAILVTSRNTDADLRRGLEVGAAAYIVKSQFDQVALLDTIRRLVP